MTGFYTSCKRITDVAMALLGILVFLPFGLLIAGLLRVTGEGEVFYRQKRVGRGGALFGVLKFATMLKDSPKLGSGSITLRGDPRVLPVGRVLRKTKLNEVPQLWNILTGEMSVIGPRPMTREDFSYYSREVGERIVSVTPGLTGVGSIIFRDEESIIAASGRHWLDCYENEISPYKGQLELWYIERRSLWLDLQVFLLTAWVVFSPSSDLPRRVWRYLPPLPPGLADPVGAGSSAQGA